MTRVMIQQLKIQPTKWCHVIIFISPMRNPNFSSSTMVVAAFMKTIVSNLACGDIIYTTAPPRIYISNLYSQPVSDVVDLLAKSPWKPLQRSRTTSPCRKHDPLMTQQPWQQLRETRIHQQPVQQRSRTQNRETFIASATS